MIKNILIFGPQGSGKGTQAEMLSLKYGIPYISTGNIFRQELSQGTDLGKQAEEFIKAGRLVPDDITNQIVRKRLRQNDVFARGFILDGYPRNRNQMMALEKMVRIDEVVVIDISDKEAIFRIGGRLVCVCGKTYHTVFNPPKVDQLCDACQKKLFIREDDKPQAIQKRLAIYHKETEPLYDYYKEKGILKRINGEQSIPDVHRDVIRALRMGK